MDTWQVSSQHPTYDEHIALWSCTDWPPITFEHFRQLCRGTDTFACVRRKTELIGMARLVTDGALYGYIQDVVVHPALRRRGIGRLLITHLMQRAADLDLRFVGLFSTTAAHTFYQNQGFTQLTDINIGLGRYLKHGPTFE